MGLLDKFKSVLGLPNKQKKEIKPENTIISLVETSMPINTVKPIVSPVSDNIVHNRKKHRKSILLRNK